jgi:hypothetical protein
MRNGSPEAWYSGPRGVAHVNSSVKISKKLTGPDYHRLGTTVRPDGTGPYHLGSRALKNDEKVLQIGFEIRPPKSRKFRRGGIPTAAVVLAGSKADHRDESILRGLKF